MKTIDTRDGGFFWIESAVIDQYLPLIGPNAFAVYACIVRHCHNATRTAYPSYTKLQQECGTGRAQVAAAIKTLIAHGLIEVSRGARASNVYHIISVTSSTPKLVPDENQFSSGTETSSESEPKLVPQRNSNYTHLTRPKELEKKETTLKSEIQPRVPARAHEDTPASARFSPGYPTLTEQHTAYAKSQGWGGDLHAMTERWSKRRLGSGQSSADWFADWCAFGGAFFEKSAAPSRASPTGPAYAPSTEKYSPEAIQDTLNAVRELRRQRDANTGNVRRGNGAVDADTRESARDTDGRIRALPARIVGRGSP